MRRIFSLLNLRSAHPLRKLAASVALAPTLLLASRFAHAEPITYTLSGNFAGWFAEPGSYDPFDQQGTFTLPAIPHGSRVLVAGSSSTPPASAPLPSQTSAARAF